MHGICNEAGAPACSFVLTSRVRRTTRTAEGDAWEPSLQKIGNEGAASRIAAALTDHPVLVLAAYFLLQAIIRALLGAPPNLDEAEQFAISDRFAFGYGPHPPLYQWLQTAAFNVLGVNFMAIAVVKNAILFAAYATLFHLALEVTGNRRLAAVACFGLLFSANFAWESQIDHTHTVTNTFLCVLTALVFFKIAARPSAWLYVALGVAMGLGMLAKYNFLLFLIAIVLAFAMDRQTRRYVLTPWFAMSLLIALAIAGPHYLYIAADPGNRCGKDRQSRLQPPRLRRDADRRHLYVRVGAGGSSWSLACDCGAWICRPQNRAAPTGRADTG